MGLHTKENFSLVTQRERKRRVGAPEAEKTVEGVVEP